MDKSTGNLSVVQHVFMDPDEDEMHQYYATGELQTEYYQSKRHGDQLNVY
jgi:hypothetical protein